MNESSYDLLNRMTPDEKIALLTGADFIHSRGVERLGIPSFAMSDGPHGLRAQEDGKADHLGLNASAAATCFPSGAAMASSWDTALVAAVGEAIGREAVAREIQVVLGPALNIKRDPRCGRSFEYYAEDPFLSGKLAASYIRALQSTGVSACPKHFACNSQEERRMVTNSVMDERTLREIYLTAFEIAVKEGAPHAIMCAYNMVNGTYCSENRHLLTDILRNEWGFDGAVISDWGAVSDRVAAAKGGLDLKMPGNLGYSDQLLSQALEDGTLSTAELDACASRVMSLALTGNEASPAESPSLEAHHILAQQVAEDCLVLLKNEGQLLPLKKNSHIAVLGALAKQPRYQGGGSSHVASWRVDVPYEQLLRTAPEAVLTYAEGYDLADGNILSEELLNDAESIARDAETVLVFTGLTEQYETEGSDRANMQLPVAHNSLVERALASNDNVVVILTTGAPVELPWVDRVKGLLATYTAGDGMGTALARILFGDANPNGKLAESWPLRVEHTPAYLNFQESCRDIRYAEGIFMGYRWYEKRALPVRFPFGYGLSYTDFSYSNLTVDRTEIKAGEALRVTVDVTNTGSMVGKECVQLYVADLESSLPRPVKELKGFSKIDLAPKETKTVSFVLDGRAFAFYDANAGKWAIEPGAFEILVGASSTDIRCRKAVQVTDSPWRVLTHVTQETTFGELADDKRTYPILCELLEQSPIYRPSEMPDASDFLRNMPLWTANHMSGRALTPKQLEAWIGRLNQAIDE